MSTPYPLFMIKEVPAADYTSIINITLGLVLSFVMAWVFVNFGYYYIRNLLFAKWLNQTSILHTFSLSLFFGLLTLTAFYYLIYMIDTLLLSAYNIMAKDFFNRLSPSVVPPYWH